MKYAQFIAVPILLLSVSGCVLFTDAATRLASDLEDGTEVLLQSGKNELEIEHRPLAFPRGVSGDYFVWLQAVRKEDSASGTLAVGEVQGERYGTSAHLHYVAVPKELRIRKKRNDSTYLLLRKTGLSNEEDLKGEKAVEVISIR
jgi:hypothetical protein